jgi:hypothetical protein
VRLDGGSVALSDGYEGLTFADSVVAAKMNFFNRGKIKPHEMS